MPFYKKLYLKLPVLSYDTFAIVFAWVGAFALQAKFGQVLTADALIQLSLLVILQWVCYYQFKVYRGLWPFSSLNDVARILKAVLSALILVSPTWFLLSFFLSSPPPYALLPMYGLLLVAILCTGRLLTRVHWDKRHKSDEPNYIKRVLIIGAGQAGAGLVRDLKLTHSYFPLGFIDDNPAKRGLEVHGVRVLASIDELPSVAVPYQVDLIFIAIPSARSATMRRIVEQCERCKIPFRTLPRLSALATGYVEANALREVRLEDLLGRDQVELDWQKIATKIQQKRIVVTGGGGSIGSELCRQIMALQPEKLLVLDNSEFNLYKIEMELLARFPGIPVQIALLSVTDKIAIDALFQQFKPQVVFHAAAYKHVPLLEDQIRVAVQNNVLGTQIVAAASVAVQAEQFIFISSDKAVNPTNIMGTTKRVAEIYCQNLDRAVSTEFITVRFGNVLGSVGSVVPLFQRQLQHGGPLTVTHPDMQRYFMTIDEACQLILQAMVSGLGGDILVLDMGEPIKISYLAEQMIRLVGKEPGKDITIKYTGLRPGEKLFEELFHRSEQLMQTEHEKLFRAKFRSIDWLQLTETFVMLNKACERNETDELLILLKSLVPEFHCNVNKDAVLM